MSHEPLRARCPAKINLALRVVRRRDDGYHELDTVFQAIDLHDTLEVVPASALTLTCDVPGVPVDGSNLVLRAAELLARAFGVRATGAAFRLRKRIPIRGGLGGGSSNAAAALLLCSRLWGIVPDRKQLLLVARRLGADVPFFLHGGTARGSGRGDRIEPLPALPETHFLLGVPPYGIDTSEVFGRVAGRLTLPGNGVSLPLLSGHKWPEKKDFGFAGNDLERVVFETWPDLERFRNALFEAGARSALLSGSGSTVYGIFDDRQHLDEAMGQLETRFDEFRLLPAVSVDTAVEVVDSARGSTNDAPGPS